MAISVLFGLCAVVLVIILVAVAITASKKTDNEEGDKNMMRSLFYYLVLFATLMMTIGGSVSVFMAVADIVSPSPYYQSFENYKETRNAKYPTPEGQIVEQEKLSDEELRERYDAIVEEQRLQQQNRAVNKLIKSLGWIIIPFPIFLYYQRRMKNE